MPAREHFQGAQACRHRVPVKRRSDARLICSPRGVRDRPRIRPAGVGFGLDEHIRSVATAWPMRAYSRWQPDLFDESDDHRASEATERMALARDRAAPQMCGAGRGSVKKQPGVSGRFPAVRARVVLPRRWAVGMGRNRGLPSDSRRSSRTTTDATRQARLLEDQRPGPRALRGKARRGQSHRTDPRRRGRGCARPASRYVDYYDGNGHAFSPITTPGTYDPDGASSVGSAVSFMRNALTPRWHPPERRQRGASAPRSNWPTACGEATPRAALRSSNQKICWS